MNVRASIEEFKDAKVNLSESASSGSCPCFPAIAVIISNKPGVIKDEDLCIHVQFGISIYSLFRGLVLEFYNANFVRRKISGIVS